MTNDKWCQWAGESLTEATLSEFVRPEQETAPGGEVVGEPKRHLEINIDTSIPTGQSNCGGGLTWASWCKKPTKNHLKISAPRDCLWPVIRTENGKNSKYSKIGQYWMPPLEPLQATMSSNVGVNNNLRLGWRYSKKQETKFPTGSLGCGGQSW